MLIDAHRGKLQHVCEGDLRGAAILSPTQLSTAIYKYIEKAKSSIDAQQQQPQKTHNLGKVPSSMKMMARLTPARV